MLVRPWSRRSGWSGRSRRGLGRGSPGRVVGSPARRAAGRCRGAAAGLRSRSPPLGGSGRPPRSAARPGGGHRRTPPVRSPGVSRTRWRRSWPPRPRSSPARLGPRTPARLSERTGPGTPRRMKRSERPSITSLALIWPATRMARHSWVNSSATSGMRNLRPSCLRSSGKSYEQTGLRCSGLGMRPPRELIAARTATAGVSGETRARSGTPAPLHPGRPAARHGPRHDPGRISTQGAPLPAGWRQGLPLRPQARRARIVGRIDLLGGPQPTPSSEVGGFGRIAQSGGRLGLGWGSRPPPPAGAR